MPAKPDPTAVAPSGRQIQFHSFLSDYAAGLDGASFEVDKKTAYAAYALFRDFKYDVQAERNRLAEEAKKRRLGTRAEKLKKLREEAEALARELAEEGLEIDTTPAGGELDEIHQRIEEQAHRDGVTAEPDDIDAPEGVAVEQEPQEAAPELVEVAEIINTEDEAPVITDAADFDDFEATTAVDDDDDF